MDYLRRLFEVGRQAEIGLFEEILEELYNWLCKYTFGKIEVKNYKESKPECVSPAMTEDVFDAIVLKVVLCKRISFD